MNELRQPELYKIHIAIFTLASALLFIFIPISFIDRFLAGVICFGVLIHIKNIKFEFNRWYEAVLFFIVCVYLMLSIVGYDLFLVNSMNLTIYSRLFYYASGLIWTCYVLQSFLDLIKKAGKIKGKICVASLDSYPKKWLILLAILVPVFALWQIAFNPIALTVDSWEYLDGWLYGYYVLFRSPLYAFFINIVCSIAPTKPEVMWIAIAQNIAFSSLLATILMYFHQRWIRFKYIIPVAVVLPLIPSFALHTIVVWADLFTGMALLWLTYVLFRIIDEIIINKTASKYQQLSFCIQLCISMVFTYFIRSNTFLVYLVMVPVLVLLFSLKKEWKLLITIAVSIIVVVLIRFPGYYALNVQVDIRAHEHRYHAAIHDIQATYYNGGRLSEQTLVAMRRYIRHLDAPDAKDMFRPDYVLYTEPFFDYDLSGLTFREFLTMYTDTFIRNPVDMTRSMLYRVRSYWVIAPKAEIDLVNFNRIVTPPAGRSLSDISVDQQTNLLTSMLGEYMIAMNSSFPAIFIWRFGVWVALMIISIKTLIQDRRCIWLLAYIPVFVYIATLLLAMGWNDYRYGLPVFFIGMFLPLALLLNRSTEVTEA